MDCRLNCGACCIAPSIAQAIPNMPLGKAAGELCANLDPNTLQCLIWGQDNYPEFCRIYSPEVEFCGQNRDQALQILSILESETQA